MDQGRESENSLTGILESLKEKMIKTGRWQTEEQAAAAEKEAAEKAASLTVDKEKKESRSRFDPRTFEGFFKKYPEIFKTQGHRMIFLWFRKYGRKTITGKLRKVTTIKAVAVDVGRSYCQSRRDFKHLEKMKVLHRWHTGNNFGHLGVWTAVWNEKDFKRRRIEEKQASKKKRISKEARPSISRRGAASVSSTLPPHSLRINKIPDEAPFFLASKANHAKPTQP